MSPDPSHSLANLGNLSKSADILVGVIRAVRELFRGHEVRYSGFALVGSSAQLPVPLAGELDNRIRLRRHVAQSGSSSTPVVQGNSATEIADCLGPRIGLDRG